MVTSLDSQFVGETWAGLKVANAKLLKSVVGAVWIEPTTSSTRRCEYQCDCVVPNICEPIQSRSATSSGSDRTAQDGDRARLTVMTHGRT
jgi:hypothetical protein